MSRKGYLGGSVMLILAAFFWGTTFLAQSDAMNYIGPFTFSAIRSAIAVPILFVIYLAFNRKNAFIPFKSEHIKHTLRGGITCGVILFLATNLQNTGLIETPPGLGGFITSLYIIFVPIVGLIFKKIPHFSVWIFAAVAIFGFYLLNITDGKFSISIWEIMVLFCAISYSFHIIACEKYGNEMDCVLLSCLQFAVVAVLSGAFSFLDTLALGYTPINGELLATSWFSIVYAAVFSSAIAFTLQIAGQKKVPATAAVLLMSLESVFAVISAWIVKPTENALNTTQIIGCIVIFLAICAAQIPIPQKTKKAVD